MRIGELAEAAGTTTKTLRFYEDQGLLPPAERTPGGYRDYTTESLTRIDFIHRGQAVGLSLAQIGRSSTSATTAKLPAITYATCSTHA